MSKPNELINNNYLLFKILSVKYSDIKEDYNRSFINCLIENKPSHFFSIYREYLYLNNSNEFLRRYYYFDESRDRTSRLSDYYKNYITFFCRPFFVDFKLTLLIHHFCDKKATLFYRNNYGSANEYHSKEYNDQSNNSFKSSLNNKLNNKTIFSKSTRDCIENNIGTTIILDSSTISKSIIQNTDKETKRSTNDSLLNILVSLKVINPVKLINKKSKQNLSLKNSLYTVINKSNSHSMNNHDIIKNTFSPKFIPLSRKNYNVPIMEFNQAILHKKNKINKTTISKNSITNSMNDKNNVLGTKRNNSNCNKLKFKSLAKIGQKPLCTIIINKRNKNNKTLFNHTANQTVQNESKNKIMSQLLQKKIKNNKTIEVFNNKQKKTMIKSQVSTSNTSKHNNTNSKGHNSKNNQVNRINNNKTKNQNSNKNTNVNQFQCYMNFTNSVSRNYRTGKYSAANRSKTKTLQTSNYNGITTCKRTISIEKKNTSRTQLKNTIGDMKNYNRINIKGNTLAKSTNTLEILKKKTTFF